MAQARGTASRVRMRLALVLALALVFGGVVAIAPTASACTSEPAIICGVLNTIGECQIDPKALTGSVKRCLP